MVGRILAAAALLSVAACGVGVEGEPEELGTSRDAVVRGPLPPLIQSVQLRSTDVETLKGTPVWKTSYVINTTSAVYLAADLTGIAGHHSATFFISMPGGGAYQRIDVRFAAGVRPANGEVVAERIAHGYRVWATLLVAGTMIEQYGLTGAWSADFDLDNASNPSATGVFSLN